MIDGKTKIYGLIGYPVGHTFSPMMHNAAFSRCRINAVYVAFLAHPKRLGEAVRGLKAAGVKGLNATVPHKEAVLKYLDGIEREAMLIGAVNTIVARGDRYIGYNTDGAGFLASLKESFGISPRHRNFFIMGAGGASRAISFALGLAGARRIVVVDDISKKAAALAAELSRSTACEAVAIDKDAAAMRELILNSDVFVNATPCGMKDSDPRLIDPDMLHKGLFVYDVIYNPEATRLLKDAKSRGLKAANGSGMLLHQGAIAFSLWTGRRPPIAVMRKAIKKIIDK